MSEYAATVGPERGPFRVDIGPRDNGGTTIKLVDRHYLDPVSGEMREVSTELSEWQVLDLIEAFAKALRQL